MGERSDARRELDIAGVDNVAGGKGSGGEIAFSPARVPSRSPWRLLPAWNDRAAACRSHKGRHGRTPPARDRLSIGEGLHRRRRRLAWTHSLAGRAFFELVQPTLPFLRQKKSRVPSHPARRDSNVASRRNGHGRPARDHLIQGERRCRAKRASCPQSVCMISKQVALSKGGAGCDKTPHHSQPSQGSKFRRRRDRQRRPGGVLSD